MTETEEPPPSVDDEEVASTPFDNPWFLPIMFVGFTFWFGYDGWINQDPDMLEHVQFNRWGTLVLVLLAVYTGWKARKETRREAERGEGRDPKK